MKKTGKPRWRSRKARPARRTTARGIYVKEPQNKILGLFTENELMFLAKFFAIFIVLEAFINYLGFSSLQVFIASTQARLLGLESTGNVVSAGGGQFLINASCTGLVSSSILFAIVFSLKKPSMKEKAFIFAAGAMLLLLLNYLRVIVVLWSAKVFGPDIANVVHVASWFSTTVFVLGLWYYFTRKVTGAENFAGFM